MTINQEGLSLLKSCEGLSLEAYPDPATGATPFTIGYGHTGDDVSPDMVINELEAEKLLLSDVSKFEQGVASLVVVPLNPNQFSAMVCFAYNVGLDNLKMSMLLRCVNTLHWEDAAGQFIRWNKAAGKVMPGLTARREKERDLFLRVFVMGPK